jgi:hypothetical protein
VEAQKDKVDHLKNVLAHSQHELKVSPKSETAKTAVKAGKEAVVAAVKTEQRLKDKLKDEKKDLKQKQNTVKDAREVVIKVQKELRDTSPVRQHPTSSPTGKSQKQPSKVNLEFVNLLKEAEVKSKEMVHRRHEDKRDAALTAQAKVELSKEEVKRLSNLIASTVAQIKKLKEAKAKADNELLKAKHAAKYAITQQEKADAQKLLDQARLKRNEARTKLNSQVIKEAKILKNKERAQNEVSISTRVSGKAQAEVNVIKAAKAARAAAKAEIQAALAQAAARRQAEAAAAAASKESLLRERAEDQVRVDKQRALRQREQYMAAMKALEAGKKRVAELNAVFEVATTKRKAEQVRVAAKLAKEQKELRERLAHIHADVEQQKAAKAKLEAQRAADSGARERKLWLEAQDRLSLAMAERKKAIARQEAQEKQMRAQKVHTVHMVYVFR